MMDDILPSFDVDFEPQSRPRSGTWPLRRPNIDTKMGKNNGAPTLSTTIEEPETIDSSDILNEEYGEKGYDIFSGIINNSNNVPNHFQSNLDNVLVGSPNVTQLSTLQERPINANGSNEISQTHTTVTELHTHKQNYDNNNYIVNPQNRQLTNNIPQDNISYNSACDANLPPVSSAASPTGANASTPKAKSSRKNAWGNMSYADLITQAIEASPDKRLTLAQIYEWMVKHIPYFKDKGDSNSSAGWKNSIRHNLSLHSKFKRIQNEGTGKSSWWVINHEAKPGKSPRRRAASMDTSSAKFKAQRSKAKQKAELKKQQKLGKGLTAGESPPWGRGINLETPVSKALSSEFRTRASSNASSVGGRLSPAMFIRDDETSLSPHSGSSGNINAISSSLPSAFGDMFDLKQSSEHLDGQLAESMAKTSIVPLPNNYQNQIQDTPNLASLLQNNSSPPNQGSIKTESQTNQGFPSCVGQYQMSQNQNIQRNPYQNSPVLSHQYPSYEMYNSQPSSNGNPMYAQQQVPSQQLFGGMQATMNQYNQQQMTQQMSDQFRIKSEPGNFPDDIDVDRPFFDSSDVDINQILADPNSLDIDFGNFGDSTLRGNTSNAFDMGMDGNMLSGLNSQQPNNSNIAALQDRGMMYQQSQLPPQSQYSMQ